MGVYDILGAAPFVLRQAQHVLVEDYLPAGCEAFDRGRVESWEWTYWWDDIDVRDNRVSFYVDALKKGRNVLDYQMRAWVPGSYHAPRSLVQAMCDPSIIAVGTEDRFEIGEQAGGRMKEGVGGWELLLGVRKTFLFLTE